LPHVHPSRPSGASVSRGGRSLVLAEREASSTQVPEGEGVELRRTANGRGDGVLATRPFAAGETVMVGFLVGGLTGNDSHATQVGPGRWALHGGLGPKVNHSCDPNCGVRLNDGQAFDFVARQPIGAGQELTFDYAMRNFTIEHFPAVCLCGAARCRGSVTGWKDLPAARKADYGELVARTPSFRGWASSSLTVPADEVRFALGGKLRADMSLFGRRGCTRNATTCQ
jgi:hypothetical protein